MVRTFVAVVVAGLFAGCTPSPASPADPPRPAGSATPVASPAEGGSEPGAAAEPGGDEAGGVAAAELEPTFRGSISAIGPDERALLVPRNWRRGCPVPLRDLRWLSVSHWGFDGTARQGPLVVHRRVARDVLRVFERLFARGFPIQRIDLPPRYRPDRDRWGDRRNVTSSYNCRPVTESPGTWSQHAYGWAIDINPVQNPYVRGDGSVLRKVAKPFRDRSLDHPGIIRPGGPVVRLFARIGWGWGGEWNSIKDYMHFSLTAR